jgi:hypothetical protein
MPLSKKALEHKRAYNRKRTKELYKTFSATLPKDEYNEICEYLQKLEINKAEFIRWAYEQLKQQD